MKVPKAFKNIKTFSELKIACLRRSIYDIANIFPLDEPPGYLIVAINTVNAKGELDQFEVTVFNDEKNEDIDED